MTMCFCSEAPAVGDCACCGEELCDTCLFDSEFHGERVCHTCREHEADMHKFFSDYHLRCGLQHAKLNLTFTNGKKVKIEFPFFLCQGRLYGIALNIADHVMPWVKVLEGNSAAAEKEGMPQTGCSVGR